MLPDEEYERTTARKGQNSATKLSPPFALFCFLTLISRGWAMDDEQMSQLLVGTWESVDDSQQAITGPAHMVFDLPIMPAVGLRGPLP